MRNFTQSLLASLFMCLLALCVSAQKTQPQQSTASTHRLRCGSMEALEIYFRQNPDARAQYLRNVEEGKRLAAAAANSSANKITSPSGANGTQAVMTIPVVVHLVLPPADMAKVTKADVLWQINKLNEDYSGKNADSINGAAFYGIRGHSQIQFCLAQQDPNGNPTDGINRVYSTITDFNSADVGKIKHANSCGADAWDPDKYLNIWVGKSVSLLGIATFPQTSAPDEQGVAIALEGFSNNPAYVNPFFALGRTLVHESGHFFGLYHIWGDDGGSCGTDDFRQMPAGCLLPGSLLIGDTPNQGTNTGGCPSGIKTDNCSTVAPGINYQNYMDYTDDACYSMFTIQQVARAEYVLNNCRTSLLSSNACTPVAMFSNDAGIKMLSPGNSCFPGSIGTLFCQNSTFSAQVMLRNLGSANLTSIKINAVVGTGTVTTFNWTGNLPPFESALVTVSGINAGSTSGAQPLTIYTSDPNGVPDQHTVNDTATISVTVNAAGVGVPSITEGFEASTFPPGNWTIINPDDSITWARTTAAKNSGIASAFMDHSNYGGASHIGAQDYLVAPGVTVLNADSIIIDFARAYKRYTTGPNFSDTLAIQLATQCGASLFPITAWRKGGDQLATSPGVDQGNWFPAAEDWVRERINVRSLVPAATTTLVTSFTSKNGYGQNLFLDDINIRAVFLKNLDAKLDAIVTPLAKQCGGTFRPSVRIFNAGKDTITSLRIVYRITGPSFTLNDSVTYSGKLALQQTAVVDLNQVTLPNPGVYNFRVWTKLPNNNSDENTANDTAAVLSFRYLATAALPLSESFENNVPPAGWVRVNQDGLGTWFRTTAAARHGIASAAMDNYNYNANGTNDDLETPLLTYSGIDSAYLTFQVSHASYFYPGSTGLPLDTFTVLVSKDCGQTYTAVYSKWGEDLQTVNNPNAPRSSLFVPNGPSQWRKETVNLTQILGASGSVQVVFRAKGNFGNTILLDDINITTKTLPTRLKQEGYLISPNPFTGSFSIQHYPAPTNLRAIQVMNAAGQVIYSQTYSGTASTNIPINMSSKATGMYIVKMIYDNKVITERVIKR